MTNLQTLSIVVLAISGTAGAIIAAIYGPIEQRITVATMILGAVASTTTALIAVFKATDAKEVAAKGVEKVQALDVKVDGRLSALIAANERAFQAEKIVAHSAGVKEGKANGDKPQPNDIPSDTLPT